MFQHAATRPVLRVVRALVISSALLVTASPGYASTILFRQPPACLVYDCGEGNAVPSGGPGPGGRNAYPGGFLLQPFTINQTSLIDEIVFWSNAVFRPVTLTIRSVEETGDRPPFDLDDAVASYTLSVTPAFLGGNTTFFGFDPNCGPPPPIGPYRDDCTYWMSDIVLPTPFLAQQGVRYYLSIGDVPHPGSSDEPLWLVGICGPMGAGCIGSGGTGLAWLLPGPYFNPPSFPQPAIGAALELRGTPVPEPMSLLLLSTGVVGVRWRARLRRRSWTEPR